MMYEKNNKLVSKNRIEFEDKKNAKIFKGT